MTMLPNIPRLYTALAEVLAVLLYARHLPRRFHRQPGKYTGEKKQKTL